MYELKKKIGKILTGKSVETGPSSYGKRIYRAAVSQRLRNTALDNRHKKVARYQPYGLTTFNPPSSYTPPPGDIPGTHFS